MKRTNFSINWNLISCINETVSKKKSLLYVFNRHKFHVLKPSALPFLVSFFVGGFLMGQVYWLHSSISPNAMFLTKFQIHISFLGLFYSSLYWGFTIVKESAEGHHTYEVQNGLMLGFYLFLITEIMLFFSFFWTYFWLSVNPSIAFGCRWPPKGTQIINPWGLPLFNTIILLLSGYTITLAHRAIVNYRYNFDVTIKKLFLKNLTITIILGLMFLVSQKIEYKYGIRFVWSTNAFWSCFFLLTGFHGFHVLLGTVFLIFNDVRAFFAKNYLSLKKKEINYAVSLYDSYIPLKQKLFVLPFKKNINTKLFNFEIYLFQVMHFLVSDKKKRFLSRLQLVQNNNTFEFDTSFAEKSRDWLDYMFNVDFLNLTKYSFSSQQHLGFEAALYYWHFVDIVWILLYLIVYLWGFW